MLESCPGSASSSGNCYPNYVWSGTQQSSTGYYPYYLNNGTLKASTNYSYTWAYGVRCVLDLKPADNCYPYWIWSSQVSGSNSGFGWLNNGTWNTSTNPSTNASGVRCVLDLNYGHSVTSIQVTAPCSATTIRAARAPTITTAGRTSYGQARFKAALTITQIT